MSIYTTFSPKRRLTATWSFERTRPNLLPATPVKLSRFNSVTSSLNNSAPIANELEAPSLLNTVGEVENREKHGWNLFFSAVKEPNASVNSSNTLLHLDSFSQWNEGQLHGLRFVRGIEQAHNISTWNLGKKAGWEVEISAAKMVKINGWLNGCKVLHDQPALPVETKEKKIVKLADFNAVFTQKSDGWLANMSQRNQEMIRQEVFQCLQTANEILNQIATD